MVRSAPFRTALTTVALATFATPGAQAEQCVGGGFRFTEGSTFVTGATRKDEPCTIGYGLFSAIRGYSIVQRPRHGALGSAGYSGIRFLTAYKPDAGYVGSDEFAVKIRYAPRSTQGELMTVVHVQMSVGP
jgi:hypothetical protein